MRLLRFLIVVPVVCLAACGGAGVVSVSHVRGCLNGTPTGDMTVSAAGESLPFLGRDAMNSVALDDSTQEIVFVVKPSVSAARDTALRFGEATRSAGSMVERAGNVVVVYANSPTSDERQVVRACVSA